MDNFRTIIPIKKEFHLSHADDIVSMGSCFADRIGNLLKQSGFYVEQNPFGVLYNPMSVVKALELLWYDIPFKEDDLFEYQGLYSSFMHHTSFSGSDKDAVLQRIRSVNHRASEALHDATCLMITFGTSWVYALAETGKIVANCHKLPDYHFVRRRLEVDEIVDYYTSFFETVFQEKPDLKVLMTVSPIRHFKDGAHENTLSKAVLHLAIDELSLRFPQIVYFPAYELLMDELRDYRFYADDLVHPSAKAVEMVWQRFVQVAMNADTQQLMKQCNNLAQALNHRPLQPQSEENCRFLQQIMLKIEELSEKYPNLDFQNEKALCHTRLNNLQK